MNATRAWTKNYAENVPTDIDPVTESMYDALANRANNYGDSPALEFFGAELTFGQLHEHVLRFANGLRRIGVKRGDRVALVMPNCPQHVIAYLAILRLGAIAVEHNPLYTRSELLTQYRDHGAKITIAWDKVAPTVQSLAGEVDVQHVIAVNMTKMMPLKLRLALSLPVAKAKESKEKLTARAPGTVPFEKLLGQQPVPESLPGPAASDIACLSYTSGTTGTTKGAILTHSNLLSNGRQGSAWMPEFKPGEETIYSFLPLFHSFGMLLGLTYCIVSASRVTLFPTFDPELIATASKKHPATFIPGVPPMYDRLARVAKQNPDLDLSQSRYAMSGAMTLTDATVERWEAVAGGKLNEGYGLTEASPFLFANPFSDKRKIGTIGLPCPSTHMKVVDQDNPDVEVELGETGELLVKGPQVFQGYWNNDEETAKVLLEDGWLRTGDLVSQDEDGFVTIVDRKKELIITGGYNVAPSEVERVLNAYDGIAESAVVGVSRGKSGAEIITAVVVLEDGAEFDEIGLRAHAREFLAEHKVPRNYLVWDELPKSMLGKVLRRQVKEKIVND
ncbi:long-chain fatty acid--CoA ligase [Gulosibacter molinativorax]|uniref:Long-chain fatty acid--CoA ligase n=2 Tax=Gulosibacter molinativorax TaxID=256821 RepID=A0ABT7C9E1_9MICO|nr:long-chain fatty acid--CoA ligase [Gulosibacter molinativorax]QUY60784.1 Long-chain-fatty-acid--CoA ligase [Gulosibacter molinativorax]